MLCSGKAKTNAGKTQMASYSGGLWTFDSEACPSCWGIRTKQGFTAPAVRGETCAPCAQQIADAEWRASAVYRAWVDSIPQGLTMEEMKEWYAAHPSPTQN